MKRLYASSLGPLELELDINLGVVSAWLFDADGGVAKEAGDEWAYADVVGLLRSEVGLPAAEAESIASKFVEAAKAEGHTQASPSGPTQSAIAFAILAVVVAALGVGLWTIATWIFT